MKKNQVPVAMALLYQNQHFLMQLRDDKHDILYPGKWGLFGGHLEPGETPIAGLIREVREEINYSLKQAVFFRCYADEEAKRYIFAAPFQDKLESLKLEEGQDFDLVALKDIERGCSYSSKIKQTRQIGTIHRQILLDFALFARNTGLTLS